MTSLRTESGVGGVLARLEDRANLIREHAPGQELARRISPEVLDELYEARLLKLWLPASLGGHALNLPDALRVFRAVSAIDGATGWAVTIGTGGNVFAAFLGPDVAAEIYGAADAVIAGSGKPSGSANLADGIYRSGGSWRYASGAH
jgi:alkylation response protein AidB-like acyl-CoA dehydrogenase